jgi:hypothetical protein
MQSRVEYPVSASQYQYDFNELVPNANKQIFSHTNLFYVDGHEIKCFFLPKGSVRNLINLKSLIMNEEIQYFDIDVRPKSLHYNQNIQLLVSYRVQNTFFRLYYFNNLK